MLSFIIQEWYRGFMSDNPDGKLNTQSFMKIYSTCFPTGNAAEFCDHVFRFYPGCCGQKGHFVKNLPCFLELSIQTRMVL